MAPPSYDERREAFRALVGRDSAPNVALREHLCVHGTFDCTVAGDHEDCNAPEVPGESRMAALDRFLSEGGDAQQAWEQR